MTVRTTCVTGFDPLAKPDDVPSQDDFAEGDDYLEAPLIQLIAAALIEHYDEFDHLHNYSIGYFWKKKAKAWGQKWIAGEAKKISGLIKHVSGCTFILEVAADKVAAMTNFELEAMIYHELCHLQEETNDKGVIKPVIAGHDTELFRSDVETYGLWQADLVATNRMFKQLDLGVAPSTAAAEEFRDSMQKMADKDGTTTTLSFGGQSVTFGPKKARAARVSAGK